MAVKYEKIVKEDLNLGYGTVDVTNPAGGTLTGHQLGAHSFPAQAFAASLSGAQSIDDTEATVELDTETLDVRDAFDPTTFTFTAPETALYLFTATAALESFTGTFTLTLRRNGATVAAHEATRDDADASTVTLTALVALSAGDAITLVAEQSDPDGAKDLTAAELVGVLIGALD